MGMICVAGRDRPPACAGSPPLAIKGSGFHCHAFFRIAPPSANFNVVQADIV